MNRSLAGGGLVAAMLVAAGSGALAQGIGSGVGTGVAGTGSGPAAVVCPEPGGGVEVIDLAVVAGAAGGLLFGDECWRGQGTSPHFQHQPAPPPASTGASPGPAGTFGVAAPATGPSGAVQPAAQPGVTAGPIAIDAAPLTASAAELGLAAQPLVAARNQKPLVRALVPPPVSGNEQPGREQPARSLATKPIGASRSDPAVVVLGVLIGILAVTGVIYLAFRWGRRSAEDRVEALDDEYQGRRKRLRLVAATSAEARSEGAVPRMPTGHLPLSPLFQREPWYLRMKLAGGLRRPRLYGVAGTASHPRPPAS